MILRLFSVLIGAALLFAPVANADQYEYVVELDNRGVYYTNMYTAIEDGKATCHYIRRGVGILDMMGELEAVGYETTETAILIQAAVKWMCPDQQGVVNAFTREVIAERQRGA